MFLDRNAETRLQSQEMGGTSASSSTSSRKQRRIEQHSPPLSPYPSFHINQNQTLRTEAHPNAMKNIKNLPILLASLADTGNHITIEDNKLTLNRRSISTADF
ncbi:hypothetical protein Acr_25g0000730 [Actinidia rufa]|uniref:Uncharacterized protein n=1 Tax=Actinidia rufa TaxID=165716 RepID=A0A7J0GYR3_9ERIC|nr:hypothetical protein Acr_25g0000730 [Actinidia rufa]